jgi:hypothetical protein
MRRSDKTSETLAKRVAAKSYGEIVTKHRCRTCSGLGMGPSPDLPAPEEAALPAGRCPNCAGYGYTWGGTDRKLHGLGRRSVDTLVASAASYNIS